MENIIKECLLSEKKRVIIRTMKSSEKYVIAVQQYYPNCPAYWEVFEDGWRDTISTTSNTFEDAEIIMYEYAEREKHFIKLGV